LVEWDVVNPIGDIGEKINEIYNLASPASPPVYIKMPIETLLTNVVGTRNLLELARVHGARFLLASTSEVYGDPLVHPQGEDYLGNVNQLGIRGCYDEGKRSAETLVADYRRVYGVDGRIVRLFNTYGPGMLVDDGRVITNFIRNALSGGELVVTGGSQTRSFCYVDDTVSGIILVMAGDVTDPVNIGNPREITIGEVADMVVERCGGSIRVVDSVVDDPRRRKPDISRARGLGWRPSVVFERGLDLTIEYIRGIIDEKQ
jgi:UDP-glucuronate decarboxylase